MSHYNCKTSYHKFYLPQQIGKFGPKLANTPLKPIGDTV